MDKNDRERCERARNRTAADRLDFIDAELRTGDTFVSVANSHYYFGQHVEARHARGEAFKACETASGALRVAHSEGQSTGSFDQRMDHLRASLDFLYDRQRRTDESESGGGDIVHTGSHE